MIGTKIKAKLGKVTWDGVIEDIDNNNVVVSGYPSQKGTKTVIIKMDGIKKKTTHNLSLECLSKINNIQKKMQGDNKLFTVTATKIIELAIEEMAEKLLIGGENK